MGIFLRGEMYLRSKIYRDERSFWILLHPQALIGSPASYFQWGLLFGGSANPAQAF